MSEAVSARASRPSSRHPFGAAAVLLILAIVVAWDASGLDLALTRQFGDAQGFPWRHAWLTEKLLHDGVKLAAVALLLLWVGDVVRPLVSGPSRLERAYWLGVALLCWLVVPAVKRVSRTSCPWDLDEFGGAAHYVSHWSMGLLDGGPGHCFPGGHATTAFGFFALVALWRPHRPLAARWLLLAVLGGGAMLSTAQVVRGAHHLSHNLWSAWLCLCVVSVAALTAPGRRPVPLGA